MCTGVPLANSLKLFNRAYTKTCQVYVIITLQMKVTFMQSKGPHLLLLFASVDALFIH